jgi:hypothetical protein
MPEVGTEDLQEDRGVCMPEVGAEDLQEDKGVCMPEVGTKDLQEDRGVCMPEVGTEDLQEDSAVRARARWSRRRASARSIRATRIITEVASARCGAEEDSGRAPIPPRWIATEVASARCGVVPPLLSAVSNCSSTCDCLSAQCTGSSVGADLQVENGSG